MVIYKAIFGSILCNNEVWSNVWFMMEECSCLLDANLGVMVAVMHGNTDNGMSYFKNKENEWWGGRGGGGSSKQTND